MISDAHRREAADALDEAGRTRRAIAPPTSTYEGLDVDDAYAIQSLQIDRRVADGARRTGWKVGLTSEAMQRQLGVDQPDFGPLLDDMLVADGGTLDGDALIAPRVEAELAFRLGRTLRGPGVTREDALDAVEEVLASLEVIDSRVADWKIALEDTIADHASCARYVLAPTGCGPRDVDLSAVEVVVSQDGEEQARGVGGAVLGHPVEALAWLANTLAPYGQALEAGEIVLAGSLHAALPLVPGTTVEATFDAAALGTVTLRVADAGTSA